MKNLNTKSVETVNINGKEYKRWDGVSEPTENDCMLVAVPCKPVDTKSKKTDAEYRTYCQIGSFSYGKDIGNEFKLLVKLYKNMSKGTPTATQSAFAL